VRTLTTALLAVIVVLAFAAGFLVAGGPGGPGGTPGGPAIPDGSPAPDDPTTPVAQDPDTLPDVTFASTLQPFDDCEQLRAYYRDAALEQVGPYGLEGGYVIAGASEEAAEGDAAVSAERATGDVAAAAPEAVGSGGVGSGLTGTNVQEAGVDEPDLVKTNGELLLTVAENRLEVVVAGTPPRAAGGLTLPDGWQHELLVAGDRVVVLTRTDSGVGYAASSRAAVDDIGRVAPHAETTLLTAVDVSDPDEPWVEATLTLDGGYRSARVVDDVARVVVASRPLALPFTTPTTGGLRAEREALEANREVIEGAGVEDWLPWSVLAGRDGEVIDEGPLLDCDDVRRPREFAGLATLSVLSIDLRAGLAVDGAAGVVADGETVYASPDRLYVATTGWGPVRPLEGGPAAFGPQASGTELHAFDLSDPRAASYLGSGRVDGTLLSSYAMSEHDGYLRVATTTDPELSFGPTEAPQERTSESAVVVLAERDGALVEVGRVGGLGRTERIQAVRFLGELATVVTFRQTDPLYTLDLSDPTTPVLLGELKAPGYSAYLHPVGDGRLLGVGQDATDSGQVTGVQASLFDLTDLAAPAQLAKLTFGQGFAAVESDPRAFLYAPEQGLAVVPLETYDSATSFTGAVALRVEGDRLVEAARLPAPAGAYGIQRALTVDGVLYTVSAGGIDSYDLDTLEPLGDVAF